MSKNRLHSLNKLSFGSHTVTSLKIDHWCEVTTLSTHQRVALILLISLMVVQILYLEVKETLSQEYTRFLVSNKAFC